MLAHQHVLLTYSRHGGHGRLMDQMSTGGRAGHMTVGGAPWWSLLWRAGERILCGHGTETLGQLLAHLGNGVFMLWRYLLDCLPYCCETQGTGYHQATSVLTLQGTTQTTQGTGYHQAISVLILQGTTQTTQGTGYHQAISVLTLQGTTQTTQGIGYHQATSVLTLQGTTQTTQGTGYHQAISVLTLQGTT